MVSDSEIPEIITRTRAAASGIPGEQVEPRQTLPTEDMEPDPSKSIKLPPNRQALLDDVIALYSNGATVERVARYAPACVYDDQFVYANGEWTEMRDYAQCLSLSDSRRHPQSAAHGRPVQDGRTVVWPAKAFSQVGKPQLRGHQERRHPHSIQEQAGQ